MDHITCPSCGGKTVPRIRNYRPSLGFFRYLKTEHQCPLCGVLMYETGGQINPIGKFTFAWLALAAVASFASFIERQGMIGKIASYAVLIGLTAGAAYWGYKRFLKPILQK